jgi:hypothetical protein
MGKVVGTVKGVFKISNVPVIQQMQLGVLTEHGVLINTASILLNEDRDLEKGAALFGLIKKSQGHSQINQLIELTKKLRRIDNLKDKKAAFKAYNEKDRIINDMIDLLATGDSEMEALGNPRMFKY